MLALEYVLSNEAIISFPNLEGSSRPVTNEPYTATAQSGHKSYIVFATALNASFLSFVSFEFGEMKSTNSSISLARLGWNSDQKLCPATNRPHSWTALTVLRDPWWSPTFAPRVLQLPCEQWVVVSIPFFFLLNFFFGGGRRPTSFLHNTRCGYWDWPLSHPPK